MKETVCVYDTNETIIAKARAHAEAAEIRMNRAIAAEGRAVEAYDKAVAELERAERLFSK